MKPIFQFAGDDCQILLMDIGNGDVGLVVDTPEVAGGIGMPPGILLKLGNAFRDAALERIKPEGVA